MRSSGIANDDLRLVHHTSNASRSSVAPLKELPAPYPGAMRTMAFEILLMRYSGWYLVNRPWRELIEAVAWQHVDVPSTAVPCVAEGQHQRELVAAGRVENARQVFLDLAASQAHRGRPAFRVRQSCDPPGSAATD